ncbi:hypothetical protein QTN25_003179 [Entamoeba marina]
MSSSQHTRFSVSTRSSEMMASETNPLETLLLKLTNDIPTGVIKHFCSTMSSAEDLYDNTAMIVGYYLQEGYLKQFIQYLIVREIEECFRTPQSIFKRNSTYTRVLKKKINQISSW